MIDLEFKAQRICRPRGEDYTKPIINYTKQEMCLLSPGNPAINVSFQEIVTEHLAERDLDIVHVD